MGRSKGDEARAGGNQKGDLKRELVDEWKRDTSSADWR